MYTLIELIIITTYISNISCNGIFVSKHLSYIYAMHRPTTSFLLYPDIFLYCQFPKFLFSSFNSFV